jgi:uncharacterized protein YjbI with pentapeptide repeats
LSGFSFRGQNLSEANLSDAILTNANLTAANLWNANFKGSDLREAILERVCQYHEGFDLCDNEPYLSREYRIYVSKLKSEIDFSNANLSEALLSKADLSGANLSNANLKSADLSSTDLSGANLQDADLRDTKLKNANLSNAILSDADLRGADLSGTNLSGANLSAANLKDAKLKNANLSNAIFSDADLIDADLTNTDLSWADLSGADLRGANLNDANLENAELIGAELDGTILSKAKIPNTQKIGWEISLRSQQADFIKRMKSGYLLHCETEGQHSELTVISSERTEQLRKFCWQMVKQYRQDSPQQVFIRNMKGKLAEEAIKARLADLITPVDYEKRRGGDGKVDFRLAANTAVGIQVKARYGNIDSVQWSISQEEVENNAVLVCVLIQEEVNEAQGEYNFIMAGFRPTNMIDVSNGQASIQINQLLYSGGLRCYLESLRPSGSNKSSRRV